MSATSPLAVGPELLDWLRRSPDWRGLPWSLRARLAWQAGWGRLNRRLSQARLQDQPPLQAPLLIVGPWRSGTTVMHELLSAATGLPTPLTWQCMNASAFLLMGGPPAGSSSIARPMDGLEIGALSPQEDEFALMTLGGDSAYRAFLMPGRLEELHPTLEQSHWLRSADDWLPRWEAFLHGVLLSLGRPGERLILKSPNHTFRLQAILRRFPEAKIVWMSRDPLATFHSNRKMWGQMFGQHALCRAPESAPGLDVFLAQALQASAATLDELRQSLPQQALAVCDQEELLAAPQASVERIVSQLGLPRANDVQPLRAALARTGRGRIDTYADSLPQAVAPAIHALAAAQAAAKQ